MRLPVQLPLKESVAASLKAGDEVLLSGEVLTGRDQACRRIHEAIGRGEKLPFEIRDQVIYFVGPSPARPGEVVGSAGPTTAGRMNPFLPKLLSHGVRGFIGKGYIADEVKAALQQFGGIYFGAIGGTGALLSESIVACEVLAYPELLSEAVHRMVFRDFPAVVLNDIHGGDFYLSAVQNS